MKLIVKTLFKHKIGINGQEMIYLKHELCHLVDSQGSAFK